MCNVHIAFMGIKTVSLKVEAYNRLKSARRYPGESFSEVVLRATWPEDTVTGAEFLGMWRANRAALTEDEWRQVDALKQHDGPPEDKWADR